MRAAALVPALDRLRRRIELTTLAWRYPAWPLCVVAIVLLSIVAVWPLFGGGMIVTGDTSHAMRIYEMHQCLSDGQLPCRWVPDLGTATAIRCSTTIRRCPTMLATCSIGSASRTCVSADLIAAIGLVAAGLSMYVLARRFWGELGGLVSAVAYMYAPYLALDIYMRGALAELWALAVLPALFWAVYELIDSGRARFVPLAALLGALLLLSHNLVAVIVAPALALWAVGAPRSSGGATRCGRRSFWRRGALWAIGLAAFFTLPVLFEGDLVQLDTLSRFPFHYSDHFATVGDLFLLRIADYSFLLGGSDSTPIQIGWFHWGARRARAAGRSSSSFAQAAERRPRHRAVRAHSSRSASSCRLQPPSRSGTPSTRCASSSSPGATSASSASRRPGSPARRSRCCAAGRLWLQLVLAARAGRALRRLRDGRSSTPSYRSTSTDADLFSQRRPFREPYRSAGAHPATTCRSAVERSPAARRRRAARVVDGAAQVIASTARQRLARDARSTRRRRSRIEASRLRLPELARGIDGERVRPHDEQPYGLIDVRGAAGRAPRRAAPGGHGRAPFGERSLAGELGCASGSRLADLRLGPAPALRRETPRDRLRNSAAITCSTINRHHAA